MTERPEIFIKCLGKVQKHIWLSQAESGPAATADNKSQAARWVVNDNGDGTVSLECLGGVSDERYLYGDVNTGEVRFCDLTTLSNDTGGRWVVHDMDCVGRLRLECSGENPKVRWLDALTNKKDQNLRLLDKARAASATGTWWEFVPANQDNGKPLQRQSESHSRTKTALPNAGTLPRRLELFVSLVMFLITCVITLVCAAPNFWALVQDKPDIYYSVDRHVIECPGEVDEAVFDAFLEENGVARARTEVRILNRGNGPASEIKTAFKTGGRLTRIIPQPLPEQKSAYVEMPEQIEFSADRAHQQEAVVIRDLAVDREVKLVAACERSTELTVELYSRGVRGKRVDNVADVPKFNAFSRLKLAFWVLVSGLIASVAIPGLLLFLSSAENRGKAKEVLLSLAESILNLYVKNV